MRTTDTVDEPVAPVRFELPVSIPTIALLLVLSTVLFLVFPSPLWRAARTDGHLLRFAFSYFAIVPFAVVALLRRHRLRLDALVTVVALVWGLKLVLTVVLYQTVGPSRRAELRAPDPNERTAVAPAPPPNVVTIDASTPLATVLGRVVEHGRAVPGAVVAMCDAPPMTDAATHELTATIGSEALSPAVLDATLGDRLALSATGSAPRSVRGIVGGVSVVSVAVLPGRPSSVELTTPGTIALESDGRALGTLLVFDHALHTRTDGDGRFQLTSMPVGDRALCVFVGAPPVAHVVHVLVGGASETTFEIGSAS